MMGRLLRWMLGAAVMMLAFPLLAQAPEPLIPGEVIDGRLNSPGVRREYRFTGEAGQVVLISLISDEFDTFLVLQDANGNQLAFNDDGGERTNSLLRLQLTQTMDYTIVVASFADSGSGAFTLNAQLITEQTMNYGDRVQGELSPDLPGALFRFNAEAGDLIAVWLGATNSRTLNLQMTTPTGGQVSGFYVDDQHARIGPLRIEEAGQYTLELTATSAFELSLSRLDPLDVELNRGAVYPMAAPAHELYLRFAGQAGQVVDFQASHPTLVTRMSLLDAFGYPVRNFTASQSGNPSRLNGVHIEEDAIYYLVIAPPLPNELLNGTFTVMAQPATLTALTETQINLLFDLNQSEAVMSFDGITGEAVRLILEIDDRSQVGTPVIQVMQSGERLVAATLTGLQRVALDFTTPRTDVVTVRIELFTESMIAIRLERSPED